MVNCDVSTTNGEAVMVVVCSMQASSYLWGTFLEIDRTGANKMC